MKFVVVFKNTMNVNYYYIIYFVILTGCLFLLAFSCGMFSLKFTLFGSLLILFLLILLIGVLSLRSDCVADTVCKMSDRLSNNSAFIAAANKILNKDFNFISIWNSESFETSVPIEGTIIFHGEATPEFKTIQPLIQLENFNLVSTSTNDQIDFATDVFSIQYKGQEQMDLMLNMNISITQVNDTQPLINRLILSFFITDDEDYTKNVSNGGKIPVISDINPRYKFNIYLNNGSFYSSVNQIISVDSVNKFVIPFFTFTGPFPSSIEIDQLNKLEMNIDTIQINLVEIVKDIEFD